MGSDALRSSVLITTQELADLQAAQAELTILDIRFRPDRKDERARYRAGHIPGAVYLDLATELAGEPAGFSGRRPLPAVRDLQRDARRWGIRTGSAVVVYDDNRGLQAGRAWFTLRWAGISGVRILDGGLEAWIAAGHATTTDVPLPDTGDIVLSGGQLPVVDSDQAAGLARSAILLDARGSDAYRGGPAAVGKSPQGHIPGAISAPTTGNLSADGTFASSDDLRARFAALGVDGSAPVAVYCGGGVAASHQIAALASIGIPAQLFPGSWSAWSSDPARPVATGSEPG